MKLDTKTLNRDEWKALKKKKIHTHYVHNSVFEGYISLMTFIEIDKPIVIDNGTVIADKNYSWLHLAPKNEHWWGTIMFNDKDELFESYFDITKENIFTNNDNPAFIDMKLDVVVHGRNKPIILDYDELVMAYEEKLITKDEFDLANKTAEDIINWYSNNMDKYYEYLYEQYKMLK